MEPYKKFQPSDLRTIQDNNLKFKYNVGDQFGFSISLQDNILWASAPYRDISGAVYQFNEQVSQPEEYVLDNLSDLQQVSGLENSVEVEYSQNTIIKQYSNRQQFEENIPNNIYINQSTISRDNLTLDYLNNPEQWLRITIYQQSRLDTTGVSLGPILGFLGDNFNFINSVNNTVYYNFDQIVNSQIIDQIDISTEDTITFYNNGNIGGSLTILKNSLSATIMGQGQIVWGIVNYAYQFNGFSYLQIKNIDKIDTDTNNQPISCTEIKFISAIICLQYYLLD